jgi:hypothetical protein
MEKKRDIPAWAAITITVFLSITAAIAAYSTRMYKVERDVDVHEVRIQRMEETQIKQETINTEVIKMLHEIRESTIRIEGELKLKKDKE